MYQKAKVFLQLNNANNQKGVGILHLIYGMYQKAKVFLQLNNANNQKGVGTLQLINGNT
jgi:hypothetical protein